MHINMGVHKADKKVIKGNSSMLNGQYGAITNTLEIIFCPGRIKMNFGFLNRTI